MGDEQETTRSLGDRTPPAGPLGLAGALSFALESMHIGVWDLDLADHTAFRSPEHDRIFGYPSLLPEWTYETFLAHVLPEDREAVHAAFQSATENHTDWEFECRVRRADGAVRWIWANGRHLYDEAGEVHRLVGAVQDITEQRLEAAGSRAAEARRRAVNRILETALSAENLDELGRSCLQVLEELTDSEFGFINELRPDGRLHDIVVSNPGWDACAMVDTSGHQGEPAVFPITGLYGHVLETGVSYWTNAPTGDPHSTGTPKGHPKLTSFLGVPLKRGEEVVGIVGLGNRPGGYDKSHQLLVESLAPAIETAIDRKRAADELLRSKQVLDAQLHNSPAAVIEFDPAFHVVRWSDTAERVFGYSAEEVLGKAISDFRWVYEEDAELVQAESFGFIDGSRPRSLNVNRNYRKDGTVIWCEWYSSAMYDVDGALTSVLSLVLDVTERKLAEAALNESQQRFKLLSEANSMLLAAQDPEGVIQPIAAKVLDHLKADVFFNCVLDDGGDHLRLNAWAGADGRIAKLVEQLELGQSICGSVARDGDRFISVDVQHNGDARADLVRRMGVRGYACYPLHDGERTIGTLSFGTKRKDRFDDAETELMQTIADQVSIAMARKRVEDALRQSEGRFRAVLENSLDAAYRRDLVQDCYDYVSPVIERIVGFTPDEFKYLPIDDVLSRIHPEDRDMVVAAIDEANETGVLIAEYRFRHKDGHYVWLSDHAVVSKDDAGSPDRRSGVVRDNTQSKQIEQDLHDAQIREAVLLRESLSRSNLLKELATAVASSLDATELAPRVLSVAQQRLGADLGSVYLLDGPELPARRIAHVGYDPPEWMDDLHPDNSTLSGKALLTRQVQVATDADSVAQTFLAGLPPLADHRIVALPVVARGESIGVVTLTFPEARAFTGDELSLYRAVAEQLGVGLENARLYEAERDIAETLQETLVVLPAHVPGVEFSREYESSTYAAGRVGGDFLDIFEVQPDIVGISLGDVSGKGIDAAVTTSLVRTTLRVHALDGLSPASVVEKANNVMRRFIQQDSFVTLWFGLLDVGSGELRFVSAGHPPALVLSGGHVRELRGTDPFIGAFTSPSYTEQEERLRSGDRLVLYSDGIIEAREPRGELFGEGRLRALLESEKDTPTDTISRRVMEVIMEYSHGSLRDDCAVLTVEPTAVRRSGKRAR